jgi:hypothetical protein
VEEVEVGEDVLVVGGGVGAGAHATCGRPKDHHEHSKEGRRRAKGKQAGSRPNASGRERGERESLTEEHEIVFPCLEPSKVPRCWSFRRALRRLEPGPDERRHVQCVQVVRHQTRLHSWTRKPQSSRSCQPCSGATGRQEGGLLRGAYFFLQTDRLGCDLEHRFFYG